MRSEPPFLVELFRLTPAGLLLQLAGFMGLAALAFNFEEGTPISPGLKAVGVLGIVVLGFGMHLTHKHARRLSAARRARASERSASPWDSPSEKP